MGANGPAVSPAYKVQQQTIKQRLTSKHIYKTHVHVEAFTYCYVYRNFLGSVDQVSGFPVTQAANHTLSGLAAAADDTRQLDGVLSWVLRLLHHCP